ncbi:MAG: ATP-grasp domain-containing protein [Gammaproteobacteria bacterium]
MGRKIRVLMTGAGAPGGPGIYKALVTQDNFDVYTCDMNINASGRFLSPKKFEVIPAATDKDFIPKLMELCFRLDIDVVFPLVTMELFKLSEAKNQFAEKGIKIIVSGPSSLHLANDKGRLYEHLKNNNLKTPDFFLVNKVDELIERCHQLGYPKKPVVIKPAIGNGSRGIRILDESCNRYDLLFNHKPSSIYSNLNDILSAIGSEEIPEIVVSEFLPGQELTIDTIVDSGVMMQCLIRTRDSMNSGISTSGRFIHDDAVTEYIESIVKTLPELKGPVGFQVKESAKGNYLLLESNPRIQGSSVSAMGLGINLPAKAVNLELGIEIDDNRPKFGVGFSRFYSEVFYDL